jgi:hypothetical protein
MYFNVCDVFYLKCSYQHVAAPIAAIYRVMVLLQEYKCTYLVRCVNITP